MAMLTFTINSCAMDSNVPCSDVNSWRLSSVAKSPEASEATCSRCMTYRCILEKKFLLVSLLERPGAVVQADAGSVTRPPLFTTSVNSSCIGYHILFSMSASPNCSTSSSGLLTFLNITKVRIVKTMEKIAMMTAATSERRLYINVRKMTPETTATIMMVL